MMCSAYRLNKQGDSRQPCRTPFSILNQSVVLYRVPTCFLARIQISHETGKMVWYSHLSELSTVCHDPHKGFSIVDETEIDVSLKFPYFLYNPANVGDLISGSSAFSKPSLYFWKFLIHILLKPSLKEFEYNLDSMWNECNYTVVWTFFGIALLWDWNENWPFLVPWPLLSIPNLLAYWVQHFNSIIF